MPQESSGNLPEIETKHLSPDVILDFERSAFVFERLAHQAGDRAQIDHPQDKILGRYLVAYKGIKREVCDVVLVWQS